MMAAYMFLLASNSCVKFFNANSDSGVQVFTGGLAMVMMQVWFSMVWVIIESVFLVKLNNAGKIQRAVAVA